MNLAEKLAAINSEEGPNITQRTLAIYTGVDQSAISKYIRTGKGISEEKQQQAQKGLRELAKEIWDIAYAGD